MTYQAILAEKKGAVGVITMNRPDVLNAMNSQLLTELVDAVKAFESDDAVRVLVLTGAGDRAFSAGADIKEMARRSHAPEPQIGDVGRAPFTHTVAFCAKPTIGALNGLAYGGGALLASCLDIRVGSSRSRLRFLGVTAGRVNSTWSLSMQVGWPIAKELLFTGRVVDPDEALRIGLLNHLVAPEEVMPKAMAIAEQIAANDPVMVQGVKGLLIGYVGEPWQQRYENEQNAQRGKLRPPPVREAFRSFLAEKGDGQPGR
jgi:enoyl-CoA hydratase/carnithine racemase